MVTYVPSDNCLELRGLSTDIKPTKQIGNGSIFFEIDTSNVYMFDQVSKQWVLLG